MRHTDSGRNPREAESRDATMTQPSRTRRILKWGRILSIALLFLTLCLWATSYFGIIYAPQSRRHRMMLVSGVLVVHWHEQAMPSTLPADASYVDRVRAAQMLPGDRMIFSANGFSDLSIRNRAMFFQPGFRIQYKGGAIFPGGRALIPYWLPRHESSQTTLVGFLLLPLYIPTILFATPLISHLLYPRFKRKPPGHCQHCGNNLFSNTSGICPECGMPIPKETREKLKAETQP